MLRLTWHPTDQPPLLTADSVHLWRIDSSLSASFTAQQHWLSEQEQARAARLVNPQGRRCFVRTHVACRVILAHYLKTRPEQIVFAAGQAGKPMLVNPTLPLEINLSTSGDLALLAISLGEPIGIDCELLRHRVDAVAIARRMFGAAEVAELAALADTRQQLSRFFEYWTALEARVKRDGRGLGAHRQPEPADVIVTHARPTPDAICALARRNLPPPSAWHTLCLNGVPAKLYCRI